MPAPHHRPRGPLRDQGDRYAREQAASAHRAQSDGMIPPPAETVSALDLQIKRKRAELVCLQRDGLQVLEDEQRRETVLAEEAFDAEHADRLQSIKDAKQLLQTKTQGRPGIFNQLSGRADQAKQALAEVHRREQGLDALRQVSLAPLRKQHAFTRDSVEQSHAQERADLEKRIEEARELGHFPERGREGRGPQQRDDPSGRGL